MKIDATFRKSTLPSLYRWTVKINGKKRAWGYAPDSDLARSIADPIKAAVDHKFGTYILDSLKGW